MKQKIDDKEELAKLENLVSLISECSDSSDSEEENESDDKEFLYFKDTKHKSVDDVASDALLNSDFSTSSYNLVLNDDYNNQRNGLDLDDDVADVYLNIINLVNISDPISPLPLSPMPPSPIGHKQEEEFQDCDTSGRINDLIFKKEGQSINCETSKSPTDESISELTFMQRLSDRSTAIKSQLSPTNVFVDERMSSLFDIEEISDTDVNFTTHDLVLDSVTGLGTFNNDETGEHFLKREKVNLMEPNQTMSADANVAKDLHGAVEEIVSDLHVDKKVIDLNIDEQDIMDFHADVENIVEDLDVGFQDIVEDFPHGFSEKMDVDAQNIVKDLHVGKQDLVGDLHTDDQDIVEDLHGDFQDIVEDFHVDVRDIVEDLHIRNEQDNSRVWWSARDRIKIEDPNYDMGRSRFNNASRLDKGVSHDMVVCDRVYSFMWRDWNVDCKFLDGFSNYLQSLVEKWQVKNTKIDLRIQALLKEKEARTEDPEFIEKVINFFSEVFVKYVYMITHNPFLRSEQLIQILMKNYHLPIFQFKALIEKLLRSFTVLHDSAPFGDRVVHSDSEDFVDPSNEDPPKPAHEFVYAEFVYVGDCFTVELEVHTTGFINLAPDAIGNGTKLLKFIYSSLTEECRSVFPPVRVTTEEEVKYVVAVVKEKAEEFNRKQKHGTREPIQYTTQAAIAKHVLDANIVLHIKKCFTKHGVKEFQVNKEEKKNIEREKKIREEHVKEILKGIVQEVKKVVTQKEELKKTEMRQKALEKKTKEVTMKEQRRAERIRKTLENETKKKELAQKKLERTKRRQEALEKRKLNQVKRQAKRALKTSWKESQPKEENQNQRKRKFQGGNRMIKKMKLENLTQLEYIDAINTAIQDRKEIGNKKTKVKKDENDPEYQVLESASQNIETQIAKYNIQQKIFSDIYYELNQNEIAEHVPTEEEIKLSLEEKMFGEYLPQVVRKLRPPRKSLSSRTGRGGRNECPKRSIPESLQLGAVEYILECFQKKQQGNPVSFEQLKDIQSGLSSEKTRRNWTDFDFDDLAQVEHCFSPSKVNKSDLTGEEDDQNSEGCNLTNHEVPILPDKVGISLKDNANTEVKDSSKFVVNENYIRAKNTVNNDELNSKYKKMETLEIIKEQKNRALNNLNKKYKGFGDDGIIKQQPTNNLKKVRVKRERKVKREELLKEEGNLMKELLDVGSSAFEASNSTPYFFEETFNFGKYEVIQEFEEFYTMPDEGSFEMDLDLEDFQNLF